MAETPELRDERILETLGNISDDLLGNNGEELDLKLNLYCRQASCLATLAPIVEIMMQRFFINGSLFQREQIAEQVVQRIDSLLSEPSSKGEKTDFLKTLRLTQYGIEVHDDCNVNNRALDILFAAMNRWVPGFFRPASKAELIIMGQLIPNS